MATYLREVRQPKKNSRTPTAKNLPKPLRYATIPSLKKFLPEIFIILNIMLR